MINNRFAEGDQILVVDIQTVVKDGAFVPSDHVKRETSREKRARMRGTFVPTLATGYNRHARKVLAVKACKEGRDELLLAGCDLLEARKEAVNPRRRSVKRMLSEVWQKRKQKASG